ncbi:hypothetical protein FB107DRAFT_270733 [Schizophyllum commune]
MSASSIPVNPWKPRLTDHKGDTPCQRSSAVSEALSQYLTSLFGYDTCMLTGFDDYVERAHCLQRALKESDPGLFLAIKTHYGVPYVNEAGEDTRGLNLDTSANTDNLAPTFHRLFDAHLWGLLYEKYKEVADEMAKQDGRTWYEICPGQIFKYGAFVFNGRKFPAHVSEHPSRSAIPLPAALPKMANESPEDLPDDVATADPDPPKRRGLRPPPPFWGTARSTEISSPENVIYSIINPCFANISMMVHLNAHLETFDEWPAEQVEIYMYLRPRLEHLFGNPYVEDRVVGGKIVSKEEGQSNIKGLRPRKPKAPSTSNATSNVRTGRGKAAEKMTAKTTVPAAIIPRTRSQMAAELARTSKPVPGPTTRVTRSATTKSSIPLSSMKAPKSTAANTQGKTTRATQSAKPSVPARTVKSQTSTTNAGPSKIPKPSVGEKVRKIGSNYDRQCN